jgi:hypothetical protein
MHLEIRVPDEAASMLTGLLTGGEP